MSLKTLLVQDGSTSPVLQKCLVGRGYDLVCYSSPSQAAERLGADVFTLVILDLSTVQEETVRLCGQIRAQNAGRRCFILVAAQIRSPADMALLQSCEPDDVLIKPCDTNSAELRLLLAEQTFARWIEGERMQELLNTRAQQQVAIAALGQSTLSGVDLKSITELIHTFIVQILEVEFTCIITLESDGESLRFESGFGWKSGLLGKVWSTSSAGSLLTQVISSQEPVIANDLPSDPRFTGLDFLREHGIVRGVSVPIKGQRTVLGILGAWTAQKRTFTEDDLHFVEGLANLLGAAMQRLESDAKIRRLAAFPLRNPSPVLELNQDGKILYENEAAWKLAKVLGVSGPAEMLPTTYPELVCECLKSGHKREHERVSTHGRVLSWHFYPIAENGVVHAYATDVTESLSLQKQVQHLQRLESVGQLAAGLAHDYNNVLTIIHGHVTLVLSQAELSPASANSLKTALEAVERAANLTRQLLVFSRKESMQPEPVDLNVVLGNVTKLLDRLLGENVDLEFQPGSGLPAVEADPGLLEQVIINLALNARDAMPRGGQLKISSSLVSIDAAHLRSQADARLGRFALLCVSDTGCGMDETTLGRIFEPFFTTKAPGKGTGLGLATVYGIIKQHQGWIEVHSELNRGTTFSVFLPTLGHAPQVSTRAQKLSALPRGQETILLLEDEAALRVLARRILEDLGYQVLEAGSAAEAMATWYRSKDQIKVLLTDLVIPDGFTGLELAERFQHERPALAVIITSGYDPEKISKGLLASRAVRFIQKPYRTEALARTIRETLDVRR